jgi:hypothetical protein
MVFEPRRRGPLIEPDVEAERLGNDQSLVDCDNCATQFDVRRLDAPQVASAQITAREIGAVEPCAGQVDIAKRAALTPRSRQIGFAQPGITERRCSEVRSGQTDERFPPTAFMISNEHPSNMLPTNLHSVKVAS